MSKSGNFYSWEHQLPYHLSVGAVVLNGEGKILVHHYPAEIHHGNEVYLLMRETLERDETLESAVKRGLREEFGIQAEIRDFLGSAISDFLHHRNETKVEKTTVYFLCTNPFNLPEGRTDEGIEAKSTLEWLDPVDLAEKSRQQAKTIGSSDLDESRIIERVSEILRGQS